MNNIYLKYPRTYHLPFSLGASSDDKILKSLEHFKEKRVVVTIKMDGENTTLTRDKMYARSLDSNNHISRNWVKNYWSTFKKDIPFNWRICGENLFAKHSIYYKNLNSYFYGFSLWDCEKCFDWDFTLEWFNLLGITPVKIIYDDIFKEDDIFNLQYKLNLDEDEGFVVRLKDSFTYDNFNKSVAKFVRKNHVNTNTHWMQEKIIKNGLTS